MQRDLIPCRVCGSENLHKSRRRDMTDIFRVGCNSCGILVEHDTKDEAVARWNALASAPVAAPVRQVLVSLPASGAVAWFDVDLEAFERCAADAIHKTRILYTAPVFDPQAQVVAEADADAWFVECRKPGTRMTYATVDKDDTRHYPVEQWDSIQKTAMRKWGAPNPDTERLNWLEQMVVMVRVPRRYGSGDLFCAAPPLAEGDEQPTSDLRAKVDEARAGFLPPEQPHGKEGA
ncbi:hypothetical protein [Pseudorhodoferax sp. Leaf265]|uniref:hypothetical protein n=1 Tax=Pseudorhodoferax sp. Leaf265 TaxID=1736315 RepID=UPI0006F260F7|nr:hypothetical protein [Pseudorhodoferax sp. Leaf265]KQP02507.1 hypothetical protein ASF45_20860 [Pseudorhodoferax sp. Leaf265]